MAFKEVLDLNAEVTISLGGVNKKTNKRNPTEIEGYYLGRRQVEDRKKKSGVSYIYILQTAKGNVGVWGKTDMDRKMNNATPGHMMKISFDKMVPTANGEMYKYKVQFDADNTIEVAAPSEVESSSSYNDDVDDLSASAPTYNEYETEDTEDESQALALAAAERKAKVEALLRGNKTKTAKN